MRKRISCKVIRTIPLSQFGVDLRHAGSSNDNPHKISNTAAGNHDTKNYVWKPAANAQARHIENSVTYTDQLNITRMPIDDALTAQVLDLYA